MEKNIQIIDDKFYYSQFCNGTIKDEKVFVGETSINELVGKLNSHDVPYIRNNKTGYTLLFYIDKFLLIKNEELDKIPGNIYNFNITKIYKEDNGTMFHSLLNETDEQMLYDTEYFYNTQNNYVSEKNTSYRFVGTRYEYFVFNFLRKNFGIISEPILIYSNFKGDDRNFDKLTEIESNWCESCHGKLIIVKSLAYSLLNVYTKNGQILNEFCFGTDTSTIPVEEYKIDYDKTYCDTAFTYVYEFSRMLMTKISNIAIYNNDIEYGIFINVSNINLIKNGTRSKYVFKHDGFTTTENGDIPYFKYYNKEKITNFGPANVVCGYRTTCNFISDQLPSIDQINKYGINSFDFSNIHYVPNLIKDSDDNFVNTYSVDSFMLYDTIIRSGDQHIFSNTIYYIYSLIELFSKVCSSDIRYYFREHLDNIDPYNNGKLDNLFLNITEKINKYNTAMSKKIEAINDASGIENILSFSIYRKARNECRVGDIYMIDLNKRSFITSESDSDPFSNKMIECLNKINLTNTTDKFLCCRTYIVGSKEEYDKYINLTELNKNIKQYKFAFKKSEINWQPDMLVIKCSRRTLNISLFDVSVMDYIIDAIDDHDVKSELEKIYTEFCLTYKSRKTKWVKYSVHINYKKIKK